MKKRLFVALLIGGIVLLIYGVNDSNSVRSDFSGFFTGSPTNKAVWLMIGGAISTGAGFIGLSRFSKSF